MVSFAILGNHSLFLSLLHSGKLAWTVVNIITIVSEQHMTISQFSLLSQTLSLVMVDCRRWTFWSNYLCMIPNGAFQQQMLQQ